MKHLFKMKTKGNNNVQIVSDCDGSTTIVNNDGIRITRNGVTTVVDDKGVKTMNHEESRRKWEMLVDMIDTNKNFDSYEKQEALVFLNELYHYYDR